MTDEPNLCRIPECITFPLSLFASNLCFLQGRLLPLKEKKISGEQFGSDLNPLSPFFGDDEYLIELQVDK